GRIRPARNRTTVSPPSRECRRWTVPAGFRLTCCRGARHDLLTSVGMDQGSANREETVPRASLWRGQLRWELGTGLHKRAPCELPYHESTKSFSALVLDNLCCSCGNVAPPGLFAPDGSQRKRRSPPRLRRHL